MSNPTGVAVDAAGDVLIADAKNNRVVKVPAGGGAQTNVGSALSSPLRVAADAAGAAPSSVVVRSGSRRA